jgi:hypothetical protein
VLTLAAGWAVFCGAIMVAAQGDLPPAVYGSAGLGLFIGGIAVLVRLTTFQGKSLRSIIKDQAQAKENLEDQIKDVNHRLRWTEWRLSEVVLEYRKETGKQIPYQFLLDVPPDPPWPTIKG